MGARLRKGFIQLLEKDAEFRYTVAAYLGIAEILKRLDQHLEELKAFRVEQQRIWQNIERLWESTERLWNEVKALREGQEKLWENSEKLWQEVRELRQGQERLWENVERLWLEVRELRQDFAVLRSEVGGLSSTVGAIAESGARRALREWAASQGLRLGRLGPVVVEGREINLVGEYVDVEGRRGMVYAEAKASVRAREVFEFARLAAAAERVYGAGLKVLLGFRIYGEAYEEAEKEGVVLVES